MIRWFLRLVLALVRAILPRSRLRIRDGAEAASAFAARLQDAGGPGRSHVPLAPVAYGRAVDRCRRELGILLVFLTADAHEDHGRALQLLFDDALKTAVAAHEVTVWAGSASEPDGHAAALSLAVTRFPFFGLLVPRSASSTGGGGKTACVSKIEGLPTGADLASCIAAVYDSHGPMLVSLRADRAEREQSRDIRAQQDSAYEASLRADRQRTDRERAEREAADLLARGVAERDAQRRRWRAYQRNRIGRLMADAEKQPAAETARIGFRLPEGRRSVGKFSRSATVADVYAWVDLQLHPAADDDASLDNGELSDAPAGYTYDFEFVLAVPMPRRVLDPALDAQVTVGACPEICPSGSLVVELVDSA